MKHTILAFALATAFAVPSLHAQTVCAQAPVATWAVQFFDRWQDAVSKMIANAAYDETMSLVPIRGARKTGYLVSFEKIINYDNECPPRPIDLIEENTAGWKRHLADSPALAEAFVAALPAGTPVGMTTFYAGYASGVPEGSARRRGVTHSSMAFPPRGIVVMWFEE